MLGEVGVAFGAGEGVDEDDHVAGFFDGHLVVFGVFAAAVDLAVGEGVLAEVVGGEGEVPAGGGRRIRGRGGAGPRGGAG